MESSTPGRSGTPTTPSRSERPSNVTGSPGSTTVRFGVGTDTLDPEGAVVAEADPGPERTLDLAPFLGEIEQLPPAFSALKVGGRRAYKLARAGETPRATRAA